MSIKIKILTIVVIANVLTSLLVILFFFITATNIIDKNMEIQAKEIENTILRNLSGIVRDIDHINYLVISDSHDTLRKAAKEPELAKDTYESIMVNRELFELVQPYYRFQPYMSGLAIYSTNNRLMYTGSIDDEVDYIILHEDTTVPFSTKYGRNRVPVIIRPILVGKEQLAQTTAFIDLDSFLQDQLESLPVGSELKIMNEKKTELGSVGQIDRSADIYTKEVHSKDSQMWFKLSLPRRPFLDSLTQNLQLISLLCLAIVFVSTLIATIALLRITNNIKRLSQAMDQVRSKDLSASVQINSRDELASMGNTFNSMVDNIQNLMVENQQKEAEKKLIEMDFLQAQINPHFLSNTLNSITWMADLQDAKNISKLSTALIDLLQATMYKGQDLISVKDEIDHIKSYVYIEQVAYADNFEVSYDIPAEIENYQILRFILQPLIENSILHNFVTMGAETGKIKISAFTEGEKLYFQIIDNGEGLATDILQAEVEGKSIASQRYNRIGVKNINRRIKLYFGSNYGLSYQSEQGKYTRVTIVLPIIKEGSHE